MSEVGVTGDSETVRAPRRIGGRIFYGWWLLAAVFVGEMLAIGSTSYAFGLFVVPLEQEFGLSRTAANSGLILFFVGMGLSAPILGRLLDRYSTQHVMLAGSLAMGLGLVSIGFATSLWTMAVCVVLLVGAGAVAIGPLAANTVLARWFVRHRGKAIGIAAVATSLGGSVVVPFMAYNLERYGWRMALIIQGVLTIVVVGALAIWVVRSRPGDLGLSPDGDEESSDAASVVTAEREWSGRQALGSRDFWCIGLSVGLTFAINQSVLVSIVPYATAAGITLANATLLVSCMAFGSIVGKLAFGAIADHVDKRWLLLIAIACTILQLGVLIAQPSFPLLLAICALAGLAIGGELPVWAALVAERFGARSLGSVLGMMNPINMALSLISIGFVGRVFDRTGNYDVAFGAFVALALLAALLAVLITRRGVSSVVRAASPTAL